MATLSDHIDRLSQIATTIRVSSSTIGSTAGPFTRAVLRTPLGDLIRDIDPAELGLFTLVQPLPAHSQQEDAPIGNGVAEVARVEFPGATPLRKPPARGRGEATMIARPPEHEPEVYAHAALKYLERYQSIRPMPRAAEQAERILENLAIVRGNIQKFSQTLEERRREAGPSEPPLSPKSIIKEEERRIQAAQAKVNELKKRKEILLQKSRQTGIRSASKLTPKPRSTPMTPSSPDMQEETFWNTPAAAARTLQFTDNLLTDEQMDLGDVSALSFASPLTVAGPMRALSSGSGISQMLGRAAKESETEEDEDEAEVQAELEASAMDAHGTDGDMLDEAPDGAADSDTVMLEEAPPYGSSPVEHESATPELEQEKTPPASVRTDEPTKKSRLRVTTELENIVSKIWSTIGEIIMPGHPFDVSGTSGSRPPRAKETIAHLQSLSIQTPSPTSPTLSSHSSLSAPVDRDHHQPTPQQVLTAHMLLALLGTPPSYAMPLNRLKEVLAGASEGGAAVTVTRPIYGCVAKRLLKIERGGGEQVVRFDV